MTFEQLCDRHWGKNRSARTPRQVELCEFAARAWNEALEAAFEMAVSKGRERMVYSDLVGIRAPIAGDPMTFDQWWKKQSCRDSMHQAVARQAWNAHAELATENQPQKAFDKWWTSGGNSKLVNLVRQQFDSFGAVEATVRDAMVIGWNAALDSVVEIAGTQYITVSKDRNCVVDDRYLDIADMYKNT